jgi:hypothetical protein
LQKARKAADLPGVQDMCLGGPQLFVAGQGLVQSTRTQLEGMESLDLGPSFQIPTGPVQGVQAAPHLLARCWKVGCRAREWRSTQPGLLQPSVNRSGRGQRATRHQLLQLVANRSGTNQARWRFAAPFARLYDQVDHPARPGMGPGTRLACLAAQACGSVLGKSRMPFRQPSPPASQTFCYCARFPTQAQPAQRLAAQPAFCFLVHASSHVGECNPISCSLSWSHVSDVVRLFQLKTVSDVVRPDT